jgi:hypothetical protein
MEPKCSKFFGQQPSLAPVPAQPNSGHTFRIYLFYIWRESKSFSFIVFYIFYKAT